MTVPPYKISDLAAARDCGVLDAQTHDRLLAFLAARAAGGDREAEGPPFDLVHLLWYAGALIVLGAMGVFSTLAFNLWGEKALLATAVGYASAFTLAGAYLWRRQNLQTPGGLLIACAVGMTPLAIFALQSLLGHNPMEASEAYRDFYLWVGSSWLPMEIGTILTALLALAFFPFPFLVTIIAFMLWFMSMDLAPWVLGVDQATWDQRAKASAGFGLGMLAVAWLVDMRERRGGDFAFWLHLFGLLAFWGGLTSENSGDAFGRPIYCAINAGLVLLSVFLARRAYVVFGGLGVMLYLGNLANVAFKDSILFPFALSGVGVLFIAAGLLFHRHGTRLSSALGRLLPSVLNDLRPPHAREGW